MKIDWLVANVTAAGSPDRAQRAMYLGGDFGLAFFEPIQAIFVIRGPLCDVRTPS